MELTPRKVLIKKITAIPNGNAEATSLRYFQQYVRGQNSTSAFSDWIRGGDSRQN